MTHRSHALILPCLALLLIPGVARAGDLAVTAISPLNNALTAPIDTSISVTFDAPVDPASVTPDSFWAFGRWSGTVAGDYTFTDGGQTVTLVPTTPFSAGEQVLVILSHDLQSMTGTPLRSAGYSWMFWIRALPSSGTFVELDSFSTRTNPNVSTRSYGGAGADLDSDGFLDLSIINEDTADVRVYMNLADGTGLYSDMVDPPNPVGDRASPNETADFNHDGHVDLCVANIDVATVSVLLGNGDGTYGTQQLISVGSQPRGIAVLDMDGDGDLDIANTNAGPGNMSLLLNDGNGVFGPPTFYEAGVSGEWSLAAADMNGDGILDLVVGGRNGEEIIVNLGNGDGTFTPTGTSVTVGDTWMINCGDLNGDGHADVASANSLSNQSSILLGDGAGNLSSSTPYTTDPFPLATDLGDVDGDGDLDWATSSFGGDWRLFLNNGDGTFVFLQEFPAPDAASCALFMDIDNDDDLDIVLIDELEDVVILQEQQGEPTPPAEQFIRGDIDGDGMIIISDAIQSLNHLFASAPVLCVDAVDANDDGVLTLPDPLVLLNFQFAMGPPPMLPFPECGPDADDTDALDCSPDYPGCP